MGEPEWIELNMDWVKADYYQVNNLVDAAYMAALDKGGTHDQANEAAKQMRTKINREKARRGYLLQSSLSSCETDEERELLSLRLKANGL
jgi:hypothetical protein